MRRPGLREGADRRRAQRCRGSFGVGFEQVFVLTDVRIMAFEARSICDLRMAFAGRKILHLVALEAELLAVLHQELRLT